MINKTEDLYCILYISTMKIEYSKEEIKEMLKLFQERNNENRISGLMLYHDRNVIQYIEGNKEELYKIYNNIENDRRHYNVIKIINEKIIKRNFIEWDMNFKEISYNEFVKVSLDKLTLLDITRYNTNRDNLCNKKIKLFFKQFLDSFTYKYI